MRRWSALLLLFIATTTSILAGEGTKRNFPQPTGFVNDFAAVIDAKTKGQLSALCTEVDSKTNAQIAVVTVQTLDGSSIDCPRLPAHKANVSVKAAGEFRPNLRVGSR